MWKNAAYKVLFGCCRTVSGCFLRFGTDSSYPQMGILETRRRIHP